MDFFTHALFPYLLGSSFKRNKQEVTALVLGGIAPDFDVFILWINYLYPTFFLITHRGFTHSLFFGFFTALAVIYVATRPWVKARVRKFWDFEPVVSRRTMAFAYIGVLIHLFLDYTTTRGVPLVYPVDTARYAAEVFFFTDNYLFIVTVIILLLLYKKPALAKKNTAKFLIIFLVAFAFLGDLRIVEKTGAEEFFHGGKAYPTMSPFNWYVQEDDGQKIKIYRYDGLDRISTFNETVPRMNISGENPENALATAGELPQVKMFYWRAYTVAVNGTFNESAWVFEYYDPVQRAMLYDAPPFFMKMVAGWGTIKVKVEDGKATVL